jgi:CRISPR-associated protein Csm1
LRDGNLQTYCPFQAAGGYFTHHHAAYTALTFDELEDLWPDILKGDMFPFASRSKGEEKTDSLINAAAAHHKPNTFLQWVVAAADRIASGFEREEFEEYNKTQDETETGRNHYQARLLPLLENLLQPAGKKTDWAFRQPLVPLSPKGIFPQKRSDCEPDNDAEAQAQYDALWQNFKAGLEKIPVSHRNSWPLWLDDFDSLWLAVTHSVPSATAFNVKPNVSLYDHGKATAALAVAIWRWALAKGQTGEDAANALKSRGDYNEKKFLLVQGDFFGIQDFIFAEGGRTNRHAAKILRGRSFQVALFTELAALRILELLELPPTSQVLNAAGKFLIVAPNIPETVERLKQARQEFNTWFLDHVFGLTGLGLAWLPASGNDFCSRQGQGYAFAGLIQKLFETLGEAKYQRFGLLQAKSAVLPAEFQTDLGVCAWHGRLPADSGSEKEASCALSRDQIKMGENLVQFRRLLVLRDEKAEDLKGDEITELPIFGYRVGFTNGETISGRVSNLARSGALRRCWDFSLPEDFVTFHWQGYARRHINAYVSKYREEDLSRYRTESGKQDQVTAGAVKSLDHLAEADQETDKNGKFQGISALTILKGDVDDLGLIFQAMLNDQAVGQKPSFAKWAGLSRQVNAFFAVYLPALCAQRFPNTYTVFAGGDDFFLIGPWRSVQKLAGDMARYFQIYAAGNPQIHFSAGLVMKKPGAPIAALAGEAEIALKRAKENPSKNSFCLFDVVDNWQKWPELGAMEAVLADLAQKYEFSTGFVYSLIGLLEMSLEEKRRPEAALWRSRLAYNTARHLDRTRGWKVDGLTRQKAQEEIVGQLGHEGIAKLKEAFRIPLFNYLYKQRQ